METFLLRVVDEESEMIDRGPATVSVAVPRLRWPGCDVIAGWINGRKCVPCREENLSSMIFVSVTCDYKRSSVIVSIVHIEGP